MYHATLRYRLKRGSIFFQDLIWKNIHNGFHVRQRYFVSILRHKSSCSKLLYNVLDKGVGNDVADGIYYYYGIYWQMQLGLAVLKDETDP